MGACLMLTDREKDYVGAALSNYADVLFHIRGRIDELVDVAIRLGIRPSSLSKVLLKAYVARVAANAGART
jgi:hypothetical protein